MANFEPALQRVLKHEGGFSDHPLDKGGMTYRGIARESWPQWGGWRIVDEYLASEAPDHIWVHDTELNAYVHSFYFLRFWQPLRGAEIHSQELANYVMDTAVLMGVGRAIRYLQEACGVKVDGIIGQVTLAACNDLDRDATIALLKGKRIAHHRRVVNAHPEQVVFLKGWINRAENVA